MCTSSKFRKKWNKSLCSETFRFNLDTEMHITTQIKLIMCKLFIKSFILLFIYITISSLGLNEQITLNVFLTLVLKCWSGDKHDWDTGSCD